MDTQFIRATSVMLVINLVYAVFGLVVAVLALKFVDKVLLKRLDLEDEIKNGNLAAAIFGSTILIFVAILIGLALGR